MFVQKTLNCNVSRENRLTLIEESCQGSSVCPRFLPSQLSCLTPCTLMRGQSWWSYHAQLAVIKILLRCLCLLSMLDSVLDHACLISYRAQWRGPGACGWHWQDLNFSLMPVLALCLPHCKTWTRPVLLFSSVRRKAQKRSLEVVVPCECA